MASQAPKPGSSRVHSDRRLRSAKKIGPGEGFEGDGSRRNASIHYSQHSWLLNGTGKLLKSVVSSTLTVSPIGVSSAAGFDFLCSYNWTPLSFPTIYVPGKIKMNSPPTFLCFLIVLLTGVPPKLKSLDLPVTMMKDAGFQFVDQNAFRVPESPFEPIFRALSSMNPSVEFSTVDVVTNRNSLRNLLCFSQGRAESSFRIDLNTVHETLFLTRHEKNSRLKIGGAMHQGFGHNFEQACTEPPYLNSCGHHRVIRYSLGHLNCVIRFEVDAFYTKDEIEEDDDDEGGVPLTIESYPRYGEQTDDSNIIPYFQGLSISTPTKENNETTVISGGCHLSSSTMAEIKTKSKTAPHISKFLPQLWFGRIPHLFLGIHEHGTFNKIEQTNAEEHFADFESKQQKNLCKMTQLISELREITKTAGGACVIVCDHRSRPLTMQILAKTLHTTVLPDHLVKRYWKRAVRAAVT
jgi:hypothetical protein